jgi:hypothetical protein
MSDAAKITLELLIMRLERFSDSSFTGGWTGEEGEAATQRSLRGGFLHFHQAMGTAQQALQAGDPEQIELAALHCQALEREGLKLAIPHAAAEARRRQGGKKRGSQIRRESNELWAPYESIYRKLSDGRDRSGQLRVRQTVVAQISKDGFVNPRTNEFPTRKTIADHFPIKKMGSQV